MRYSIFTIPISTESQDAIVAKIVSFLTSSRSDSQMSFTDAMVIVTPNPEQLVLARHNKQFKELLQNSDIALPDGIGVVWALQLLYGTRFQKISGVDFMESLIPILAKRGVRIGFLGGHDGVALNALECLWQKYGVFPAFVVDEITARQDGTILENSLTLRYCEAFEKTARQSVTKKVKTSKKIGEQLKQTQPQRLEMANEDDVSYVPSWNVLQKESVSAVLTAYQNLVQEPFVLFVALGAPKQELLMHQLRKHSLHQTVSKSSKTLRNNTKGIKNIRTIPQAYMAVGGSFDVLSGHIRRAPLFIRNIGFEWFWRLYVEPWRWKRQLVLFEYVFTVLMQKILHTSR